MADLVRAINTARLDPLTLAVCMPSFRGHPPTATVTAAWDECSSAGFWPGVAGWRSHRR